MKKLSLFILMVILLLATPVAQGQGPDEQARTLRSFIRLQAANFDPLGSNTLIKIVPNGPFKFRLRTLRDFDGRVWRQPRCDLSIKFFFDACGDSLLLK